MKNTNEIIYACYGMWQSEIISSDEFTTIIAKLDDGSNEACLKLLKVSGNLEESFNIIDEYVDDDLDWQMVTNIIKNTLKSLYHEDNDIYDFGAKLINLFWFLPKYLTDNPPYSYIFMADNYLDNDDEAIGRELIEKFLYE